jgi:Fe-S-cluster containining protein
VTFDTSDVVVDATTDRDLDRCTVSYGIHESSGEVQVDASRQVELVGLLHAAVDELAAGVARAHGPRLRCGRGCSGCCVDDLTVFEVEAARIRAAFPELLAFEGAGPPGACAMLDAQGACRIYAARPYVCRTQGLPLRWLEGEVERRDICALNEPGPPLEDLAAEACWSLGPFEARLAAWQAATGAPGVRVALRDLFAPRAG